ncbi:hybrid sensor histidine kinase/response regulator transcription factor [Fibrella aquatica]|uniref:hybrid sensor histidine kinase/response regulator transcription factor n=1 Tax=Fibrella aquatica TaxID=3242487 RepID=UPI0035226626
MSIGLTRIASSLAGNEPVFPKARSTDPPYIVQVRHFSVEQGLPNRSVTGMGQDGQGFVWIGTLDNAYRFDGNRFMPLPAKVIAARRQTPVYVDNISADQSGNLWFFKGRSELDQWLERWNADDQKVTTFPVRFEASTPKEHLYPVEAVGHRGSIISKSVNSLLVVQGTSRIYRHAAPGRLQAIYIAPQSLLIQKVCSTAKGTLLLTLSNSTQTQYSLLEIDSLGRQLQQQALPKYLKAIGTDAQGNIYLHHVVLSSDKPQQAPALTPNQLKNYLYRLAPDGHLAEMPINFDRSPFPQFANQNGRVYAITDDEIFYDAYHDLFWYRGKGTLFAWHPARGVVFDLATSGFSATQAPVLEHMMVDRTGGIWINSNNGVLLLTLTPNRFSRYLYQSPNTRDFADVATRGLIQVGNRLWANAAGSWLVNLNTGAHEVAMPAQTIRKANLFYHQPVAPAPGGSIWSALDVIARIDPVKKTIVQYPLRTGNNMCWSIKPDGRQNLWLGYNEGISYFDVAKRRNIPFTRYNKWPELAENRINGFFFDKQVNGFWVASTSGLYVLDTLRGIVDGYNVEQTGPKYLPFNHIAYIHIDPDQPGLYWLATRGGGLIRWERATGRYRQFTQADGLLNKTLYCLYTDHPDPAKRRDKDRLWMTTDYGLVSFNKKTGRFQTYLPKDGITHEEFNFTSHYQASDGRLYLGGLNGITAFWPNQIQETTATKAPLVVTGFQQLDGNTGIMGNHTAEYILGQPIHIESSSRAFMLSFTLLDYRFLGQTQLWYRIKGWQNAWSMQRETDLRVNGLPPGAYELEVRMQNLNGHWISNVRSISLVVEPPIYQRLWFVFLCLLTIVGVTVAIFRWRNRRLLNETIRLEAEVSHRTAQIEQDKSIIEQQAAELRENATLKSRFFANVTHEFRTPLTLLLGPLTYLMKRDVDGATYRMLATMERNARQLQELVNDLLGLGKLEAGQLQLDSQPANLITVVNRTVAAFATQASFAGIKLDTLNFDQPVCMLIDVPKLETVLRNLIANALRFTPAGGSITIMLGNEADLVRLSVKDTGRGIHPDDLPHVMERYYQSGKSNVPLQGGTGIGLAICHEYCQLWQGQLTIDSELGRGCTITLTYPKVAMDIALPDEELQPESSPGNEREFLVPTTEGAGRELILIVEDNPDMATYIQVLLAPHYACHWCRNGFDALNWLSEQASHSLPHLILTDMMMPEMDGLALLQMIRKQSALRPIPVIMLTARFNQEVRLQALKLGVADYLTKPFDEDELLVRIQNLLDRARERAFWGTTVPDEPEDEESTGKNNPFPNDNWIQDIQALVVAKLTDSRFQVTDLAEATNMSQRQFYRRLKTLTGLSPIQFVQEVRLQTAYEWIEEDRYKTVKEVAYRVGFQKVSYFSRLYQQRFGVHPSLRINEQTEAHQVVIK